MHDDEYVMGGPVTALPADFTDWDTDSLVDQCTTATSATLPPTHVSYGGS